MPHNLLYGGTSVAAPQWASYIAILNQGVGNNIAPSIALYPFAETNEFHNADSLSSDFTHVGLGSPNLDVLLLALSSQSGRERPTQRLRTISLTL